jgi:hypothetical protein
MKKLFLFASILMLAISCNTNQHISASAIGLSNLENYAAKSNLYLPNDFNYLVITNQQDFDNTFGITTSGNINITYPGFNAQTVVACIAQPATSKVTIRFDKAEVVGKELHVYCTKSESGAQLKNAYIPVAIAAIPKVLSARRVVFYTNGEKVMTKALDFNNENKSETENITKDNNTDNTKPVVLKRTMRRPAVI